MADEIINEAAEDLIIKAADEVFKEHSKLPHAKLKDQWADRLEEAKSDLFEGVNTINSTKNSSKESIKKHTMWKRRWRV